MKSKQKYLHKLIENATIDCYDEYECLTSFGSIIEENFKFPFTAYILGHKITIKGIVYDNNRVGVICKANGKTRNIDICDIEMNKDLKGSEWIEAYKLWRES